MGNFKLVHFVEFPLHEMDKLVPKIKKVKGVHLLGKFIHLK